MAVKTTFGRFVLDSGRRLLLADDRPVPLSPKAFDVLALLVDQAPDVVEKDTIVAVVWEGQSITDASLAMAVTEIRRALGDSVDRPAFIRTAHRRGYAFCASVDRGTPQAARAARVPKRWLRMGDQTFILGPGQTLVGREPSCGIWIDRPGISRRHARFIVQGAIALIEDLKSLNGTCVGAERISRRTILRAGDVVTVGDVQLTFGESSHTTKAPTKPLRGQKATLR